MVFNNLTLVLILQNTITNVELAQSTLEGPNNYEPCVYVANLQLVQCDYILSEIPIIKPTNEKPVRIFRLTTIDEITSINDGILSDVSNTLEELFIEGAKISTIQQNALQNLSKLKKLTLKSGSSTGTGSSGVDLGELIKSLTLLNELVLSGINISENLGPNIFKTTTIKAISISNLPKQVSFHEDTFKNSGFSIESLSFDTVLFTNQSLIPYWLKYLTNLKVLEFKMCSLKSLPEIPSSILKLQTLNLERNYLNNLQNCINFQNSKDSIIKLILSFNVLTDGSLDCLNSLTKLQELDLRHCTNLKRIPSSIGVLQNLTSLNLENCGLSSIYTGSFVSDSLLVLTLNNNPLTYIDPQVFEKLGNLEVLLMNNVNMLETYIDSKKAAWKLVFSKLKNLKTLFLSYCKLNDDLLWDMLSHVPSKELTTLHLSFNDLTHIPRYFFASFQEVKSLNLKSNNIRSIDKGSLYGLPRTISSLDLSVNQLSTLDACEFYHFDSFKGIFLANNPLICDCNLNFLKENVTKDFGGIFKCAGPEKNKDKQFNLLTLHDLTCEDFSTNEPCEKVEIFTKPSTISTTTTILIDSYNVTIIPIFRDSKKSIVLKIFISNRVLSVFKNIFLEYIYDSKTRNQIIKLAHLPENEVEISNVISNDVYSFTIILELDGVRHRYPYNNINFTVPTFNNFANAQIIGGAVAGGVLILLVIIGVAILVVCRRRRSSNTQLKVAKEGANSPTKTDEESVYDYDYPVVDHKPREFVRASTHSTIIPAYSQEIVNPNFTMKTHPLQTIANNRHVQSTFDLKQNYDHSRFERPTTNRQQSYDPNLSNRFSSTKHPPLKSISASRLDNFGSVTSARSRVDLPPIPNNNNSDIYPYEQVDLYDSQYLGMSQPSITPAPTLPPPRQSGVHNDGPNGQISKTSQHRPSVTRSHAILTKENSSGPKALWKKDSPENSQTNSLFSDVYDSKYINESSTDLPLHLNSQATLADVKDIGIF